MSVHDLLQWWNLVYLAPLMISLVWIITTVLSGMHGYGDHIGGHDAGQLGYSAGHGDAGHVDGGHAHNGADHSHHSGNESNSASRIVMLFGIDKVPITLLIGVFLLCWGVIGMLSNQFFSFLKYPAVFIWPSLAVTFFVSTVTTRFMAAMVGRMMPGDETYGVSRYELVGSLGRTVFAVNECNGTINIKDRFGTVHRVQAKTEPEKDAIPSGADVIVVDFDEDDKHYIVRPGTI